MAENKCPLGDHNAVRTDSQKILGYKIKCDACGTYRIAYELAEDTDSPIKGREYLLSGIARRRSDAFEFHNDTLG